MFVKPGIPQHQAARIFSSRKGSSPWLLKLFSRKNSRPPERLEIVYLPFYVFDVLVEKKIKGQKNCSPPTQKVTLSVDGLLGHAVLYAEDTLKVENNPETPVPVCRFMVSSSAAAKIALDHYKGILLEHGLRTRSHPQANKISEGREIYYPFWLAYFKKKKGYDFKAMDAVSGAVQGITMRRVFMKALRELG